MSGEKTEKPTGKRLRKARKDGQVARTHDLAGWSSVMAASFILPWAWRHAGQGLRQQMVLMGALIQDPDIHGATALTRDAMGIVVSTSAPLLLTTMVIAVMGTAAQGGLPLATAKLKPNFKALNPMSGIKRLLGPQGAWEAIKSLLKIAVVGAVVWHSTRNVMPLLASGASMPLGTVVSIVSGTTLSVLRQAALTGLFLAALDYAVIKRRTSKGMRMSKDEVKDEARQAEGDPKMKGAIRSRQLAMSRNRMMSDVAKADVVLVNPTHVAVALRYDPMRGAPRVVAKGAGVLASRIRALAEENRVPMVQDIPLARTLYKSVDIGGEVPPELYTALARVLAFVLSLKARGSAAGMHRVPTG